MERGMRRLSAASSPAVGVSGDASTDLKDRGGAGRDVLFSRLVTHISQHAGFRLDEHLHRKTTKLLAHLSDSALEQRVRDIMSRVELLVSLVEELTVHETYFNRDGNQFALLKKVILPDLVRRARESSSPGLRIWSAASSTGEEAYTLVMVTLMALRDAGEARENRQREIEPHPRWNLEVIGSDISQRILERARQGIYHEAGSMGSFREMPEEFRPYFDFNASVPPWGERELRYARIRPSVSRYTRFEIHNLADGMPLERDFDVILCRNVLIYFGDDVKYKVLGMLWQALKPEGVLLLGPPDSMPVGLKFETCWRDGSVYYVKKGH